MKKIERNKNREKDRGIKIVLSNKSGENALNGQKTGEEVRVHETLFINVSFSNLIFKLANLQTLSLSISEAFVNEETSLVDETFNELTPSCWS
jgi:hypothetical protein